MDNDSKPEILSIVTEDLSSTPAIHADSREGPASSSLPTTSHGRKSSDPSLLGPRILKPGRRSVNTSASKVEARGIPPSPTLSTQSSVHFKTNTALQENKPGDKTTSLSLLSMRQQPVPKRAQSLIIHQASIRPFRT